MHKAKIILNKKERKTGYGVCMIQNQHMHSKKYKKVEDFIAVLNLKLTVRALKRSKQIFFSLQVLDDPLHRFGRNLFHTDDHK